LISNNQFAGSETKDFNYFGHLFILSYSYLEGFIYKHENDLSIKISA